MRRRPTVLAVSLCLAITIGALWAVPGVDPLGEAKSPGNPLDIQPTTLFTTGNARWAYYLVNTRDLTSSTFGLAPLGEGEELDLTRMTVTAAPSGATVHGGTVALLSPDDSVVALAYIASFGTQQLTFDPPIPIRPGYQLRLVPNTGSPAVSNWQVVLSGYVPGMPRFASGVRME